MKNTDHKKDFDTLLDKHNSGDVLYAWVKEAALRLVRGAKAEGLPCKGVLKQTVKSLTDALTVYRTLETPTKTTGDNVSHNLIMTRDNKSCSVKMWDVRSQVVKVKGRWVQMIGIYPARPIMYLSTIDFKNLFGYTLRQGTRTNGDICRVKSTKEN